MINNKVIFHLFFSVVFASYSQNTTAQSFSLSTTVESRPYAPVSGTTLSDQAAVVFGVEAKIDSTSLTYLKSFSWDTLGRYDGMFLSHKFWLSRNAFHINVIHFADWNWEKNSLTALSLKGSRGDVVKTAMQISYFHYRNRARRWIINPTISYKQFTIGSWIYNEFGDWSCTMGINWESPEINISKKINLEIQCIYNDSWTKRLGGEGFGQKNTMSIGLVFSKKEKWYKATATVAKNWLHVHNDISRLLWIQGSLHFIQKN